MRLLIVDDEIQIRTGLEQGVDWERAGICQVVSAANGIEALDMYKHFVPDIVLTDIRMPTLDGLGLIKSIREMSSNCKIIILSGYSEFEYAKKAIQYNVTDYILKPINIGRLISVVKKASEQRKHEVQQSTLIQGYWKDRLFQNILSGRSSDLPPVRRILGRHIHWTPSATLRIGCLQIDDFYAKSYDVHNQQRIEEWLTEEAERIPAMLHVCSPSDYILLLCADNKAIDLTKWWVQANRRAKQQFDTTLSLGISHEGDLPHASGLFHSAEAALRLKVYKGAGHVYFGNQAGEDRQRETDFLLFQLTESVAQFEPASFEELELWLNRQFDSIEQDQCLSARQLRGLCKEIIKKIEETTGLNERMASMIDSEWAGELQLKKLEGLGQFRKHIVDACEFARQYIQEHKPVFGSRDIARACFYIQEHYCERLTVKDIAAHIGQSPNYFSHKFKLETGCSFTHYLNRVRIEQAARLIRSESGMPLYEISRTVGFQDYKYFTQVFKKLKKVAPSRY